MFEKFCYSLQELARKWGCSENDILHLAVKGKIFLSVNMTGFNDPAYGSIQLSGWYVLLVRNEISAFLPNNDKAYFRTFCIPPEKPGEPWLRYRLRIEDGTPVYHTVFRDEIAIMASEVSRFEAEHPDLLHPAGKRERAEQPVIATTNKVSEGKKGGHKKGGSPKGPLAEAVEMAYLHFRDKGNVAILQSGNIRSFLKSFKSLTDDSQSKEFGNGNVCAYLAERIKEVKIPRAGKCLVTTHDRRDGRKTKHGQDHSQNDIAKLLTKLRKKLPLPS